MDLVNFIGFDAVDNEVSMWIETGAYDNEVRQRALELGWVPPHSMPGPDDEKLF